MFVQLTYLCGKLQPVSDKHSLNLFVFESMLSVSMLIYLVIPKYRL